MKHINWSRDLELGIPSIDTQHRQLVRYVNELRDAISARNRSGVEIIQEELIEYLISHFEFEEKLLEKAGYPYFKAHRRVHAIFVRKMTDLRERTRNGEDTAVETLYTLHNWLTRHIKNEDLDYVETVSPYLARATPEISAWLAAASPLGAVA